jgi:predicted restriction endonuclease
LVNRISDNDFKEIVIASYSWKEIGDKLGYQSNLSINVKNAINNRCETLGISLNFCKKEELLNKTKGSLFSERKNWQSARTAIRKNATETYFRSNKEHKCAICGYNKHIEVAHIKAVSDFSNNATIREINSITNLIGLCPNHHWEYDHGLISL